MRSRKTQFYFVPTVCSYEQQGTDKDTSVLMKCLSAVILLEGVSIPLITFLQTVLVQ
jgi:hypothetical protein